MTQAALAKYIGVSHQAVSQYLRGKSNPSFEVLYNISVVLGTSLDFLLGRSDIDEIVDRDIDAFIADATGLPVEIAKGLRLQRSLEKAKPEEHKMSWGGKVKSMAERLKEEAQKE